ncbi:MULTISPECIES: hypothetical protein [unclassified Lysobacter]|uniref:hypothetical protein n=1 Tax=unclassified Lysobacter TaxID=2635362 RepID=UPI0020362B91|nr:MULTISPECIES: hypothetical protein [unclassified Lysobacter]
MAPPRTRLIALDKVDGVLYFIMGIGVRSTGDRPQSGIEVAEPADIVGLDACRAVGLRSMIVVPLKHHDSVVGVLKVATRSRASAATSSR